MNLFKKKIIESPNCPICLGEEDLVVHALWECTTTKDVRSLLSKTLQKSILSEACFKRIFAFMNAL